MRKHWMAIPIAAVAPFQVLALVLWKTEGWSNGALGVVELGLMSVAAIVGSLMAPPGVGSTPRRLTWRSRPPR